MRVALLVSALAGLAAAAPRPQDIEVDVVDVSKSEIQGHSIVADVSTCRAPQQ